MHNYPKQFFQRILKDLKQSHLLTVKLLFFMHSSTILVLYPYVTIYMRELGISVEETAIMSGVIPVIAILMPPLAGMMADSIGNFRLLLSFISGAGGLAALLLLAVPIGRVYTIYPENVELDLTCSVNQPVLSIAQPYSCIPQASAEEIRIQMESCGFVCNSYLNESDIQKISTYDVQIFDANQTQSSPSTYKYSIPPEVAASDSGMPRPMNKYILQNNEAYRTAIRKIRNNTYFFPSYLLFNFTCDMNGIDENNTVSCLMGSKEQLSEVQKSLYTYFNVKLSNNSNLDYLSYNIDFLKSDQEYKFHCQENFVKKGWNISITTSVNNSLDSHFDVGNCVPECLFTAPRSKFCSNKQSMEEIDMQMTFWSFLSIRVFVGILSGTAFAMFEGAVIAILREHKADYGLQRIYATIGGMISSPIAGWLIDFASRRRGYTDFRPIFFLYAALKVISAIIMLFINLKFKKPSISVVSDVFTVLRRIEMLALLIACLISGCAWGFIESFLFWLLQDLGGTKSLMGLTITVGGLVGIPLLVLSGPIIKRVGHANIIFVGFVFYAIRLVGYSIIYNPWLCLIFEAMEAFTFGLSLTAAVTYAAKLSSLSTDSSVQGLLGGLYYGVGKGVGSFLGGYLIKATSIRTTFQIFSVIAASTGLIYILFYHFYIKIYAPCPINNEIEKDDHPKNHETKEEIVDIPVVFSEAVVNTAYEDTETSNDPKK